jgi:hypothetical protein
LPDHTDKKQYRKGCDDQSGECVQFINLIVGWPGGLVWLPFLFA